MLENSTASLLPDPQDTSVWYKGMGTSGTSLSFLPIDSILASSYFAPVQSSDGRCGGTKPGVVCLLPDDYNGFDSSAPIYGELILRTGKLKAFFVLKHEFRLISDDTHAEIIVLSQESLNMTVVSLGSWSDTNPTVIGLGDQLYARTLHNNVAFFSKNSPDFFYLLFLETPNYDFNGIFDVLCDTKAQTCWKILDESRKPPVADTKKNRKRSGVSSIYSSKLRLNQELSNWVYIELAFQKMPPFGLSDDSSSEGARDSIESIPPISTFVIGYIEYRVKMANSPPLRYPIYKFQDEGGTGSPVFEIIHPLLSKLPKRK